MSSRGIGFLCEAFQTLRVSRPRALSVCASAGAGQQTRMGVRTMATAAPTPTTALSPTAQSLLESWYPSSTVPLTIHSFPSLEPISLEHWSIQHLFLPLRRDLVYRAICYEGDSHRQGSANSKTRYQVAGSHAKMHPQKGTGRARVGSRQSPLLRGGGKTFGPHPRDFSTRLNKKIYDKAWRTALSYRYRRGELLVCNDGMDFKFPFVLDHIPQSEIMAEVRDAYMRKYTARMLAEMQLAGRTLFVTRGGRRGNLYEGMLRAPRLGRVLDLAEVDVKDLLETRTVVMERSALHEMVAQHQSDLVKNVVVYGAAHKGPPLGVKIF
ncbi:hypothetical protein CDD81_6841 [Ophiocordyceps australis]|uniref:Large ribosomal subunit protein uL4m n=1 Tax=Ophiocordyceps australis TaxID=1399860 RepID=A0A2C5Y1P4_9HYPO|nr:hypothetical protein CDD81_6841 [Ophiocordyceps australis]